MFINLTITQKQCESVQVRTQMSFIKFDIFDGVSKDS
jgi:hypothetical protein